MRDGSVHRLFSPLVEHAIELSAQWHDRTYRKGRWRDPAFPVPPEDILKVPVAAHVMVVGHLVQRAGWDDATVAAAVLHDVIEDGNRYGEELRFEELGVLLGEQVAKLVLEVTERKYDEDGAPRSWRQRKSDYVENLRDVSPAAVAISLADKLHNLWSINESITQGIDVFSDAPQRRRLSAGPSEQIWFYEAVLDVSRSYEDNRLRDLREDLQLEIGRFRDLVTKLPT